MTALRKEPEVQLQLVSATALAELMVLCSSRTPSPNDKLIRNICTMAWSDPTDTPSAAEAEALMLAASSTAMNGDQQRVERQQSHRGAGARGSGGTGADGAGAGMAGTLEEAGIAAPSSLADKPEAQAARISRLGAEATLKVGPTSLHHSQNHQPLTHFVATHPETHPDAH